MIMVISGHGATACSIMVKRSDSVRVLHITVVRKSSSSESLYTRLPRNCLGSYILGRPESRSPDPAFLVSLIVVFDCCEAAAALRALSFLLWCNWTRRDLYPCSTCS